MLQLSSVKKTPLFIRVCSDSRSKKLSLASKAVNRSELKRQSLNLASSLSTVVRLLKCSHQVVNVILKTTLKTSMRIIDQLYSTVLALSE